MSIHDARYRADALPMPISGGRKYDAAVSYERELLRYKCEEVRLRDALLCKEQELLQQQEVLSELFAAGEIARKHVASLSPREHQIMELVVAGHPSKNIAADLGISQRTVENHRHSIMKKTGSMSLPALARLAFAATWNGADKELAQH